MTIRKIAKFLHIIDDFGQLDLTDLAFICIIIKIMMSSNLDWPSVIVLATACMNKMHRRSKVPKEQHEMKQLLTEQTNQIKDIQQKVKPIIDAIKSKI